MGAQKDRARLVGPVQAAKNALTSDGFAEAEDFAKKAGMNPNSREAGIAGASQEFTNIRLRRQMLSELGDTHFGISWQDFKEIATTQAGFTIIQTRHVPTSHNGQELVTEDIIAVDIERRLLLHANNNPRTTEDSTLNHATVYGAIHTGNTPFDDYHKIMTGELDVETGDIHEDKLIRFSFRGTDGLLLKLDALEKSGFEYTNWELNNKRTFMIPWLLTPEEEADEPRRRELGQPSLSDTLWENFLATSPQEIRDFIL
jgi:hypothetical protein